MLKKIKEFRLGEALVEKGWVSGAALEDALESQKKTGELLGQVLLREGGLPETRLLEMLAEQWGLQCVDPALYDVPRAVLEKVPAKFVHHYGVFPLEFSGGVLHLAASSLAHFESVQELGAILGAEIKVSFAEQAKIAEAIEKNYGIGASVVEKLVAGKRTETAAGRLESDKVEAVDTASGEGSVRELVNMLLLDAKQKRASDIHLEPFQGELVLRYRIDGVLQETSVPEAIRQFHGGIITRIKIMAQLDIAERRVPQDGRIKIRAGNEELDLRISLLPTAFGEALVIRILSPARLLNLGGIGLGAAHLGAMRELIDRPHGIILLSGPTGSGKTTTLYAALSEINTEVRKIITVEDPVEYQLRGIIQMQVHPKIGLTFASGLRHMLRHDPDVMMIGEIRDAETAEIAVRSALTGHLVFSTLHTNDAPGAVARLTDLGVGPYLVSSSLNAVIAQRLVRVLCPFCREKIPASEIRLPEGAREEFKQGPFYEGRGCDSCRGTGYMGRSGIHELMLVDDEVRDLMVQKIPASELRRQLVRKGMKTLLEDGLEKARQGTTSLREVLRVVR
ncbi:MAG TPA: GspE/PulE family protein [Verrucomicrobiae bacterium]|nr:GspE/PulE family protein [Verrucomicrobiae bacterium]